MAGTLAGGAPGADARRDGRDRGDPDYIVVGAGSAGCVIVNRLSADPSVRVLLLEAGPSGEGDPQVTTPGRWTSLLGTAYDWSYRTEPERGLRGRLLAFPRGRALGGSSAINAMVHIRGPRQSFDDWRDRGNPGWGYDDLLPFFRRSERSDTGNARDRGFDGPLAVSRCRDPHDGHDAFLHAAAAHGFQADALHDFNGPDPEGVAGFFQKNILAGRRHSAAAAFLLPALERGNVEVRTGHVTRLLLDRARVVGLEYLRDGRPKRVRTTREVVLCAGAVGSPCLLMRSGIGEAVALGALGIRVMADLPGVGRHLQDHLKLGVRWQGRTRLPGSTVTAGLFTATAHGSHPDLQFYVGRGLEEPDPFVTITVSLVRPESRGTVRLRSLDPLDPPIIQANYLQAQADVDALVAGARLARRLGASAAYAALRGDEIAPGPGVVSTADLEVFVRQMADTIYHAAGTCRMGPASDREAVVDSHLRVHGIDGLRVADASIMPEAVRAPTHAACVMIGERCAALIGEAGPPRDEPAGPA